MYEKVSSWIFRGRLINSSNLSGFLVLECRNKENSKQNKIEKQGAFYQNES